MPSTSIEKILDVVAVNVRRLRTARGLTQKELAAATEQKGAKGVMWRSVQDIEAGEANPTLRVLVALADVLGVSVVDLLVRQPSEAAQAAPPKPSKKSTHRQPNGRRGS